MNTKKYHYVYRITNTKINKHYYGTRTSEIEPSKDLGVKYFSSSSDHEFRNDQKNNPQNYKYVIVSIFNSREEAIELEIKLHDRFNVGVNESFYNKTKQTNSRFDFSGNQHTLESRELMKLSHDGARVGKGNGFYGKTHTNEWREKRSKQEIGKLHEIVECPVCKKIGGLTAMKQHHFDNCGKNDWVRKRSELVECPHCNKIGGSAGMLRHHFENCKQKQQ